MWGLSKVGGWAYMGKVEYFAILGMQVGLVCLLVDAVVLLLCRECQ